MSELPPGFLLILGALLLPQLRRELQKVWMVALPVLSFVHLMVCHPVGHTVTWNLFGMELVPVHLDGLSRVVKFLTILLLLSGYEIPIISFFFATRQQQPYHNEDRCTQDADGNHYCLRFTFWVHDWGRRRFHSLPNLY